MDNIFCFRVTISFLQNVCAFRLVPMLFTTLVIFSWVDSSQICFGKCIILSTTLYMSRYRSILWSHLNSWGPILVEFWIFAYSRGVILWMCRFSVLVRKPTLSKIVFCQGCKFVGEGYSQIPQIQMIPLYHIYRVFSLGQKINLYIAIRVFPLYLDSFTSQYLPSFPCA